MAAPKLVFEWEGRGDLSFRTYKDSDGETSVEVEDDEAKGSNQLTIQEAAHLHAWLGIVLANHYGEE